MAGHSKWANIKHRKASQDAKKGAAYAKCTRELIMAAKVGGADPAGNFRLRTAIDKAKASGLPNDTIDRAIAKGSGQSAADNVETLVYEGYGPGGVAVYIQAMTDNRNRTAGDIRSYFNKFQGNLGETGCVGWMFEERGQIQVEGSQSQEDNILEVVLEAGGEDIQFEEEAQQWTILTPPDLLNTVCEALQHAGLPVGSAEVTRVCQTTVQVTDPTMAKPLLRLLDAIESHDDVQNVYANFEMDDTLIEACLVS